jgi:hypothetical protein
VGALVRQHLDKVAVGLVEVGVQEERAPELKVGPAVELYLLCPIAGDDDDLVDDGAKLAGERRDDRFEQGPPARESAAEVVRQFR